MAALGLCVIVSGCGRSESAIPGPGVSLHGSDAEPQATLEVRGAQTNAEFGKSATAKPLDRVYVKAMVENADRQPIVRLAIPDGPAKELGITIAGRKGKAAARVTLRPAHRKTIEISKVEYICFFPAPSPCPVDADKTRNGYELSLVAPAGVPIVAKLTVGPDLTRKPGVQRTPAPPAKRPPKRKRTPGRQPSQGGGSAGGGIQLVR